MLRNKPSGCLILSVFMIGFPIFLLMEHPVAFWLICLPASLIFIVCLVKWFDGGSRGYVITAITILLLAFPFMFIMTTLDKCEHEETSRVFSFEFENSAATSYTKLFCKNCEQHLKTTIFQDTPNDLSYREVVDEHIDGDKFVGGEYYTMTAIVTLADYDVQRTRIRCKVENEDIGVVFSVEFKDDFEKRVSSIQEGDEITFRGRLYDNGFGWTDCELLEI